MSCRRILFLFLIGSSLVLFPVSAQDDVGAVIAFAEGGTFDVVSNGVRSSFDVSRDDVIGMVLKAGDILLTDGNTFLEIGLNIENGDRSGVVKVVENTTFTIEELDSGGGGVFKVIYGRIRVRIAGLLGGSRLWVTGHDTVAGVRGTDFGYDLFYDRATQGGERQTVIYCFDGEVDVLQYDEETTSKIDLMEKEPYLLGPLRMVTTGSSDPTKKLKSQKINNSILEYWDAHPIISGVGSTAIVQATDTRVEVSKNLNLDTAKESEKDRFETGGKIVFVTGIGMMTLGGILRAVVPDSVGVSTGLLAIGGTAVAAGGSFMIYSIALP